MIVVGNERTMNSISISDLLFVIITIAMVIIGIALRYRIIKYRTKHNESHRIQSDEGHGTPSERELTISADHQEGMTKLKPPRFCFLRSDGKLFAALMTYWAINLLCLAYIQFGPDYSPPSAFALLSLLTLMLSSFFGPFIVLLPSC